VSEDSQELSPREREILDLLATGATNRQIALALGISVNTVKVHLRNIFGKLDVASRTEATLYAIQHGLVQVEQPITATPPESPPEPPTPLAPQELYPTPSLRHWVVTILALLVVTLGFLWSPERQSAAIPEHMIDQPHATTLERSSRSTPRWRDGAQLPLPRGRFAQAALEGRIYVISGLSDQGWTPRVDVYDPEHDVWDHAAAKPTAVANIGAAIVDERVYVPGGLDSESRVRDILEIYDPVTDTWSEGASLPKPLCAYAIAPYRDQGFFVFGGWDGQTYVSSVYYYDVIQDRWAHVADLSAPRAFAGAAALNELIYLVGGYDGRAEYRLCESFDPAAALAGSNPWQTHSPMHQGRAGHAVVAIQQSLYVIGGGWTHPFDYNERYDATNDVWTTFDSPLVGEWRTLGASTIDTPKGIYIYAIGGWNGQYSSVVKRYQAFFRIFLP